MRRRIALVLSAAAVIAAALLVPMPLVEYAPGYSLHVAPLLSVDAETTQVDGELGMVIVYVQQPSIVETLRSAISDAYTLQRRQRIIPDDLNRNEYFRRQRENFRVAFDVATAVGQRAAGYRVDLVTSVEISQVLPRGPSDGILETGDVVVEIRGEPVSSAEELIARLSDLGEGETVEMTIDRDGERLAVEVDAAVVPQLGRPGLGVGVSTIDVDVDPAVDVELLDQNGIGGTSAGLVIALTTYDLLSPEDLASGRKILATGTVDAEGNVGRIGAIRQKVITAVEEGADILLVPAEQADEALSVGARNLRIIPVETFDDALDALRNGA